MESLRHATTRELFDDSNYGAAAPGSLAHT